MTDAANFLVSLRERGVHLWVESGQLRFRSSKGPMLPDERDQLRARKAELIELLQDLQGATDIPLTKRPEGAPIPLVPVQAAIWNHHHSEGKPHIRFCAVGVRILGVLNLEALQRCLTVLVARHEPLRTRIALIDGVPRQLIDGPSEFSLKVIDADPVEPDVREFVEQEIEFSTGPLFDVRLFRQSPHQHVLVMSIDHLITDGVTNAVLNDELWVLYEQCIRGQPLQLPALQVQYADYAVWLEKLYPKWLEKHERYWRERLADAPPLRLPVDRAPIEAARPVGTEIEISLDQTVTSDLFSFAQRERVMPAVVMLAIFAAALSRWCNQKDLVVVLVDSGRHLPALASMVGWVVDHLHLRIRIKDGLTFLQLLERVKDEFASASHHRDFNWAPSLVPPCSTDLYFNWLAPRDNGVTLGGVDQGDLSIQPFPMARPVVPAFRFALFCAPTTTGLIAKVIYRADMVSARTIESFVHALRLCAERMVRQPLSVLEFP